MIEQFIDEERVLDNYSIIINITWFCVLFKFASAKTNKNMNKWWQLSMGSPRDQVLVSRLLEDQFWNSCSSSWTCGRCLWVGPGLDVTVLFLVLRLMSWSWFLSWERSLEIVQHFSESLEMEWHSHNYYDHLQLSYLIPCIYASYTH